MKFARPTADDRVAAVKLAQIEILAALAAVHRRFCAELPSRDSDPTFRHSARRAELKEKSALLSGCDELEDSDRTVRRYSLWLETVRDSSLQDTGDEFDAADCCIKRARELVSIARIARAFPDSASRRARKIAKEISP